MTIKRAAALLALACLGGAGCPDQRAIAARAAGDPAAPPVRVAGDRSRGVFALRAEDASLTEIAAGLERAAGCRVEVEKKLGGRRLTLDLSVRPLEHLFMVLARRADARLTVAYRMEPLAPGEASRRGALAYAREPVSLAIQHPVELAEALPATGVRVEVAAGVSGRVRLTATGQPLARVLDRIAAQVKAQWVAVVRLQSRTAPDPETAALGRMHDHFSDLAALSPDERLEELAGELEAIGQLPPEECDQRVRQVAGDVLSLATLYQSVPGEHREQVAPRILAVAGDYAAALSRLPPERQAPFAPIADALTQLRERLGEIR